MEDNDHHTRRDVLRSSATTSGALLGATITGSANGAASHGDEQTCVREPGLQGQVPLQNQLEGRTETYCRNTRLVGQNTIEDRGANFQMTWYGDYAYVGMAHLYSQETDDPLWGTAVIDASDPHDPQVTTILKSPANLNAWEAMSVSERRDLLVVSGSTDYIDVFDLSDPADPTLISSTRLPVQSHGLILSPDAKTAYISSNDDGPPGLIAIDVSDPARPEVIATHPQNAHDVQVSRDGKRLYLAFKGVIVFDTSEIERRKSDPEFRPMGERRTKNTSHAGAVFRRNGRRYFVTPEEIDDDTETVNGACPWAWVRIYDVTDDWAPRQVGQFKLQVNEVENCDRTQKDMTASPGLLTHWSLYSSHYMGLDTEQDPNAAFVTWYGSGLRVTDVRDHEHPTEIAYYNPSPNPNTKFGEYSIFSPVDQYLDSTTSYVRYRPETGNIWFVSGSNGFQIVELTGGAADIPR